MRVNNTVAGSKRKADFEFTDESAALRLKRAKTVPTEDMMVIGLVPMMTIAAPQLKVAPNQELVNHLKRIILSGTKTQKQVAKECGLSQTKMSQFMNLSPRVHGWDTVESKVNAWINKAERNQRSGHRFESDYSVPQSCVTTSDQSDAEELGSTVYVQNRSNPWHVEDASTSTTSNCTCDSEIEGSCPIESNKPIEAHLQIFYSRGDEVINTSSDLSENEISRVELRDPTTNSKAYVMEGSKSEKSYEDPYNYRPYVNDCAWDNFSIIHALESSS